MKRDLRCYNSVLDFGRNCLWKKKKDVRNLEGLEEREVEVRDVD